MTDNTKELRNENNNGIGSNSGLLIQKIPKSIFSRSSLFYNAIAAKLPSVNVGESVNLNEEEQQPDSNYPTKVTF